MVFWYRTIKLLAVGVVDFLLIHEYRRYPVIPNPLGTFIIKNRQSIGIVIERNSVEKDGVNKSEKIS